MKTTFTAPLLETPQVTMLDPEQYGTYCRNDVLYTEEPLSGYVPGGYHPVALGDKFHGHRYKVHHKLGFGSHSTVWLARDRRKEKWVALKIAVASSPKHEFENLEYLRRRAQGYLWGHNIVQLLDHFTHQGPNGYHDCLVLELLGPDIRRYIGIRAGGPPKPPIDALDVNKMAGQLAAAVSFMYRAGIDHHKMEHGGISDKRVAVSCHRLSGTDKARCLEIIGTPRTERLFRLDGKELDDGVPNKLVQTAQWPGVMDVIDGGLRLIGFGDAFLCDPPGRPGVDDHPVLEDHPVVRGLKLLRDLLRLSEVESYDVEEAFHFLTTPTD